MAVTVASKEASHQAPLSLPTSIGSAEMKNYRKRKKAGCVTWVRDRDGLGNIGNTGIAETQITFSYKQKKLIRLPRDFVNASAPQAASSMPSHTPTRCDRTASVILSSSSVIFSPASVILSSTSAILSSASVILSSTSVILRSTAAWRLTDNSPSSIT